MPTRQPQYACELLSQLSKRCGDGLHTLSPSPIPVMCYARSTAKQHNVDRSLGSEHRSTRSDTRRRLVSLRTIQFNNVFLSRVGAQSTESADLCRHWQSSGRPNAPVAAQMCTTKHQGLCSPTALRSDTCTHFACHRSVKALVPANVASFSLHCRSSPGFRPTRT